MKRQSVRMFYEQHVSNIFIYQEQVNGQSNAFTVDIQPADQGSQLEVPLQQSAQLQQPQKFVMGMSPDSMLANLLKYGNDDIMLLDATFEY